jgi:hypothetical protein
MGFETTLQDSERPKLDGLSRVAQRVRQIIFTQQKASSETNNFSAIHGNPSLSQNPKFHRHVHETRAR